MSLKEQLVAMHADISKAIPEDSIRFDADTEMAVKRGVGSHSLQVGDAILGFELPGALGNMVASAELLSKGALVISFYRGGWCPYCNLELRALQLALPEIEALGASLVAISPQLPDGSMSTMEKAELTFPVLSDVGNKVARQFGLVFQLSEELRPLYERNGIDLPRSNGEKTFELPVPGTFILNSSGKIIGSFVSADYKQRMEPEDILGVLKSIQ